MSRNIDDIKLTIVGVDKTGQATNSVVKNISTMEKSTKTASNSLVAASASAKKFAGSVRPVAASVSQLGAAFGGATSQVGRMATAATGLVGAFAVGGPLMLAIAGAGLVIGKLVDHFSRLQEESRRAAEIVEKELATSLQGTTAILESAINALGRYGKSLRDIELEKIGREQLKISQQIAQAQKELAAQEARLVPGRIMSRKAWHAARDEINKTKENILDLKGAMRQLGEAQSAVIELSERQAKDETKSLTERASSVAGVAVEWQRLSALLQDEAYTGMTDLADAFSRLTALFDDARKAEILAMPFRDATEAIKELRARTVGIGAPMLGMQPRMTVSDPGDLPAPSFQSPGSSLGGINLAAMSGLSEAGVSSAMGGGALASALAPALAAAAPAAAAAFVGAWAAAVSAPLVIAGTIGGKIIADGIVGQLASIPDMIADTVLDGGGAAMQRFLDEMLVSFETISKNVGPVLQELIAALPDVLRGAAVALVDTLISVLIAGPDIVNQFVFAVAEVISVVMTRLPDIIKAAIPAIIQTLFLAISSINLLWLAPMLIPFAMGLMQVLGIALLDAMLKTDWGAVMQKSIGSMMVAFGNVGIAAYNSIVSPINSIMKTLGSDWRIPTMDMMPNPYSGTRGSYPGAGGGGGGGGGSSSTSPALSRSDIPVFHGGGWVRAHDGMFVRGDEQPIIAQSGERVLSRREVAAMGGPGAVDSAASGSGGGGATINLVSFAREDLERIVREVIAPYLQNLRDMRYMTAQGWVVE